MRHIVQRRAFRRQQPRYRSILEFLSVSSQFVLPSSPPVRRFYRGDNYSDAGGYERGKHVPDLLMAERLAHELGVPVSFFYEPHENLARLLQLACFLHPDRLQAILRQLSDELQLPK